MPDIAGAITTEIRLPLTEGPGFLEGVFLEREDDGPVEIGVVNNRGFAYAFASVDPAGFWRIVDTLFPEGRPVVADPL